MLNINFKKYLNIQHFWNESPFVRELVVWTVKPCVKQCLIFIMFNSVCTCNLNNVHYLPIITIIVLLVYDMPLQLSLILLFCINYCYILYKNCYYWYLRKNVHMNGMSLSPKWHHISLGYTLLNRLSTLSHKGNAIFY